MFFYLCLTLFAFFDLWVCYEKLGDSGSVAVALVSFYSLGIIFGYFK